MSTRTSSFTHGRGSRAHRASALLAVATTAFLAACGGGQGETSNERAGLAAFLEPTDGDQAFVEMGGVTKALFVATPEMVAAAIADTGYALAWSNSPGGVSVATDGADNVYSVLWDYNAAGDIYLTKRNADGVQQWEVRFDNTDLTRHELATWVGTDSQGNVLVSGTIRSGYSGPVNANSVLMKFSPAGQLLWRRVYESDFDGSSTRKLLVDSADNIYVLGLGTSPSSGQRATVRKFRADGSTEWSWFDPVGIGLPLNFKWTADGDLVVAGRTSSGNLNGYARLNPSGNTVWALPAFYSQTAGDAAGDAAGNTYLINGNPAAGGGSVLRKLGPSGSTLWERTHPIAALRVEVGSDAAAVIGGFPNVNTAGAAFAKFDANGNLQWANLDADGPGVALLAHEQMRLDAQNNVYLAAGNMTQMGVTKVRSDGTSAWTALVPFGYAKSMAFGSNGKIFVAGGNVARIDQAADDAPPPPPPPPPPAAPDLAVNLTDMPERVRTNGDLVITARIANQGPSAATSVNFGATVHSDETLLSVVPSRGSCTQGAAIDCSLGTIGSGEGATVTLTYRVTRPHGALTTSASVNCSEADAVVDNNTALVTTMVEPRRFRPRR